MFYLSIAKLLVIFIVLFLICSLIIYLVIVGGNMNKSNEERYFEDEEQSKYLEIEYDKKYK